MPDLTKLDPTKEPTAAAVLALANRMIALKASPGFHDLRLICEMLEQEATEAIIEYPGHDRDQLFVLKVRAQAAKELVVELFGRIEGAIANGRSLPGFDGDTPEPTERIAGSYI